MQAFHLEKMQGKSKGKNATLLVLCTNILAGLKWKMYLRCIQNLSNIKEHTHGDI